MNPVWILEEVCGKTGGGEDCRSAREMKKRQATVHLLTSLDDIAWL